MDATLAKLEEAEDDPWGPVAGPAERAAPLLAGASASAAPAAAARARALQGVVFAARASSLLSKLRTANEGGKVAAVRDILGACSGMGAHALLHGGVIPLLLQTLGSRLGSAELYVWSAGALAALACYGGGGGAGGSPVEAALCSVSPASGGGAAANLPSDATLAALFACSPRAPAQVAIAAGGGVAALCAGLSLHAADARASAAGALALRFATLGMDPRLCEALPLAEVVDALRGALAAHAGDAGVVMHAAWALRNVAAAAAGRACPALLWCAAPLVGALRAWGGTPGVLPVLEPLARAACNLALAPPLLEALAAAGAVDAVGGALARHAHEAVAAECCCAALANLAVFRAEGRAAAFAAVAPRLAELVLVPHADNLAVVKPCVRLARNLAVDEALRREFFNAEGVPTLIDVMRRHARGGATHAAVLADCRMVLSCAQDFLSQAGGGAGGGGGYRAPTAPPRLQLRKVWGRPAAGGAAGGGGGGGGAEPLPPTLSLAAFAAGEAVPAAAGGGDEPAADAEEGEEAEGAEEEEDLPRVPLSRRDDE
jgi:hypothetical protein